MTPQRQDKHDIRSSISLYNTYQSSTFRHPHSFEPFLEPRYNFNQHSLHQFPFDRDTIFKSFVPTNFLYDRIFATPCLCQIMSLDGNSGIKRQYTIIFSPLNLFLSHSNDTARSCIRIRSNSRRFLFLIMIPHPHIDFSFPAFTAFYCIWMARRTGLKVVTEWGLRG